MIIFMDPPEHRHMRSLLNKVFTPRAIQAQKDNVIDKVEKYLSRVDRDEFDAVQDFTAPFPVEVITTMLGVPEENAQQVRHWIDDSLHREVGQVEIGEQAMQANIETGDVLLRPGAETARRSAGRSLQQAHRGRDRARGRQKWTSSTTSKSRLSQAFSAGRAPRR